MGGAVIEFFFPAELLAIKPGEKIRMGYEIGTLGRPDVDAYDGVGIYGTNTANPTYTPGNVQRQRLEALETFRAYTVRQSGWSKKFVATPE